jgi:hypothetical protein
MCDCITKLNKELLKDKRMPVLEMSFGMDGTAYPYMEAMYLKGRSKKFITILPTFCPFCGKEYKNRRSI